MGGNVCLPILAWLISVSKGSKTSRIPPNACDLSTMQQKMLEANLSVSIWCLDNMITSSSQRLPTIRQPHASYLARLLKGVCEPKQCELFHGKSSSKLYALYDRTASAGRAAPAARLYFIIWENGSYQALRIVTGK